eukprot:COSAG02_NODE_31614_length_530_cov_1.280742_1_plen_95_part_00
MARTLAHHFRAYQFVYSLVRPKAATLGEPESCEVMGLMRLQLRGDCPRKAIDTVATQVVKDVWARVRAEAIARMKAEPANGGNSGEPNAVARPC